MSDFAGAGELRTRITFQSPTVSKDPGGAQSAAFANVASNPTVWGRWVNDHGQELVQSEVVQAHQRATVTVRHRTDLVVGYSALKDTTEPWEIISIDPVQGRQRWIALRVQRVKGGL